MQIENIIHTAKLFAPTINMDANRLFLQIMGFLNAVKWFNVFFVVLASRNQSTLRTTGVINAVQFHHATPVVLAVNPIHIRSPADIT